MRFGARIDRLRRWLLLAAAAVSLAGCSAPPSVVPLLEVGNAVLRTEAARLAEDAARQRRSVERERAALAEAFDRDLRERASLDAAWVGEAVRVYAAARDALTRHAAEAEAGYAARADNLAAAAEAQRRAVAVLEHQRRLWPWNEGLDAWRLRDRVAGAASPLPFHEGGPR